MAIPIMVGSAAQNAIAATDSVFLYHLSENDFAAIGFVSTFYLIIAAIGYSFSKAGQILIARRMGQKDERGARQVFQSMLVFELLLALGAFLFMELGGAYALFAALLDSDVIFYKSLEYLSWRSWGVFGAYAGMAFIALYTGLGRTNSLLSATLVLFFSNLFLNYALIFGHGPFPAMGIAGAGLASTIAEYLSLFTFLIYMRFDEPIHQLKLLVINRVDFKLMKAQANISLPIVLQSIIGLGSWLFFFGVIDNLGERALAVTNLVRVVYLALCIPSWGFASVINTMSSHFIGKGARKMVRPLTSKVSWISMLSTLIVACPSSFSRSNCFIHSLEASKWMSWMMLSQSSFCSSPSLLS